MSVVKLFELMNTIGEEEVEKIDIFGQKPKNLKEPELVALKNIAIKIQERNHRNLHYNSKLLNLLQQTIGNRSLEGIKICGLTPHEMDILEIEETIKFILISKLRNKPYLIAENIWEYNKEEQFFYFSFHYNKFIVSKVKLIPSSTWCPERKEWKVHISELRQVNDLFRQTQSDLEYELLKWKEYRKNNILRLTNKGCYLTGLNLPIQQIHSQTSILDPNHRHMEAFKNGSWDGRIPLYDKYTGFFPYGLFDRVMNVLKYTGTHYQYFDERIKPTKKYNFKHNLNLRDYQEKTIEKALASGRGILQLATGAGKTKTASSIVSSYGMNTIFFVHTKFLLGQAKEALTEVLGEEIGQVGDGIIDIKPVSVAMVQTVIRALGGKYTPSQDDEETSSEQINDETDIAGKEDAIKNMLLTSDVVFFDECQFVAADSFYTIANFCPAYYKFGLSATPYRSDKKDLMIEAALGPILHKINASYLIKRGFLTQPYIHFFPVGNIYSATNDSRKYQQIYREDIVENGQRNEIILNSVKKLNNQFRSVLVLVQQVNHGKLLKELFLKNGINVEFVSGEDDLKKREAEIFKLRTKQKLTLIATTIADEGLDVPSLDAVILGGGGKSPSKGMQRVGRAIRVFKDKERAFEIYHSAMALLEQNANFIIITETEKDALIIKEKFEEENQFKNSFYIDIIKEKVINEEQIVNAIVPLKYIDIKKLNHFKNIKGILMAVSEHFNTEEIKKIEKLNKNTFIYENSEEFMKNLEGLINSEIRSTLILVEETKLANEIQGMLKVNNKKAKYLTGKSKLKHIQKEIKQVLNNNSILIVNSSYLEEEIPYHDIDRIFVVGSNKISYKSIEKISKDLRIFTIKDKAIIVDFKDNSKYLQGHSLERKLMFETEDEFKISGWK